MRHSTCWKSAALVCLFSSLLAAQTSFTVDVPLPPGTVGVPYTFNFGEGLEDIPTSLPGIDISFSF